MNFEQFIKDRDGSRIMDSLKARLEEHFNDSLNVIADSSNLEEDFNVVLNNLEESLEACGGRIEYLDEEFTVVIPTENEDDFFAWADEMGIGIEDGDEDGDGKLDDEDEDDEEEMEESVFILDLSADLITEVAKKITFSAKGGKGIKMVCGKGKKWNSSQKKCVKMSNKEMTARSKGAKKAAKKRKGGAAKKAAKARAKAMKKRG